jgi:hypothetical protein
MTAVGQAQPFADVCSMSGLPPKADLNASSRHVAQGRVEDGRGRLGPFREFI